MSAINNPGVTSVGLALPSIITVSGSPVTSTGTLTGTLATQAANLVFAGPVSGGAAAPTFRALVAADVPGIGLQPTYLGAASATDNIILLTTAGGPVKLQDNATPLSDDLFSIKNSAANLSFFFADDFGGIGMQGGFDLRTSLAGVSNNASVVAGGAVGVLLQNTTAATALEPVQNSPLIELDGKAWNTTSSLSKNTGARIVMQSVSANPTSQNLLIITRGTDGGAYATRVDIGTTDSTMRTLFTLLPPVATSGSPTIFTITGPANTTLAASTEAIDVNINLARTVQFATGALTTQRAMVVQAPTYGFVAASTLTTAATVAIVGAPAAGTNATITNAFSLWIQNGKSCFDYPNIASVTTTGLLMRNNTGGGISNQLPPVIEFAGTLAISESAVAIYGKVGLTGANSGGASVSYLTFIVREQTGGADVEALRLTASTTTSQVLSTAAKNLSITSDVADSGTNVGVIFNNSTALTGTTLLMSVRNAGVEKFAIADDGSLALQGTTTGTYTLGGTPTLGSALAIATDGTDIGTATNRVDLFALTVNSGASTLTMTTTVATGSNRAGFIFKDTNLAGSDSIASFQSGAATTLNINNLVFGSFPGIIGGTAYVGMANSQGDGFLCLPDAVNVGFANSGVYQLNAVAFQPQGDVLRALGTSTLRWTNVFSRRYFASGGTASVAGDFALSAGWGTTASVGTITGEDAHLSFVVTSAGTGQGADPTITYTFKNGTWTNAPWVTCHLNGASTASELTTAITWTTTATTVVLTFRGTPTATRTYTFQIMTIG